MPITEEIKELSGRAYEITPSGYRIAQAEIITTQQECFLRSLAIYRIPSLIEDRYDSDSFLPLCFILNIMNGLVSAGYEMSLSFQEFALYVQTATLVDGIDLVV